MGRFHRTKSTKGEIMAKRGRKSKLTPELQERICNYIENGYTVEQACALSGIGETTYYRWLQTGRKAKTGKYREFWEAVKKAEKIAESKYLAIITRAAVGDPEKKVKGDWKAAAWYLERRNPQQFARRDFLRQDVNAKVKGDVKLDLRSKLKEAEEFFRKLDKERDNETE